MVLFVDVCIVLIVEFKLVREEASYFVTSFLQGLLLLPAGTAVRCRARRDLEATVGPFKGVSRHFINYLTHMKYCESFKGLGLGYPL